ncbi:TAXI family TRAP transporter solute-binding subunit [Fervidibacillus albus]|uniref:TAXI family TRAP transporter solute-binding subunit n=1 Tax=Fervidibacillus albus TaxID=2980026 RepID=A0A9E8LY30_9BACI|nr:TAXI family TRAP transporter solute-binding subunit [Fervidibacillus albus]WAA10884.1 TAXI family TRAP transporter solute-binding subunit [Fervidibacillus albus]
MKKKKWSVLAIIALGVILLLSACSDSDSSGGDGGEKDLVMGTGSQGGTYFGLGSEMANVWNNNIENINVTATESGASIENLGKIASGDFDLGMTVNLPAYNALEGVGEFEGKKVENFAFIGHIYPEVLQVITRESTGVNSIEDLKGKRIAIGPPGSGTQTAAKIVLAAYGIEDGDYEQYQEGFGDAKAKLQDGTIDASFGLLGLPSSSIDELNVAVGDVKILNIEGDALSYVEENGGYSPFTIPSDSYEWLDSDVQTVSAFAILVANTDTVDDDTAYQLAKVMIENADENTHPQSKHTTKENALNGLGDLPLHPGAEKYYEEIGLR